MASGYEHAPVTQVLSVFVFVLSFFGSLTIDGKILAVYNFYHFPVSMQINFHNYPLHFIIAETGAAVNFYELNFQKLSQGEIWRLATSHFIFSHTAQVLVGIILLYTCREFERQMGSRKFSAFLLLALGFSIFSLLALVVSTY